MSSFVIFISGVFTGVYIAQKYDLPDIGKLTAMCIEKIRKYENDNKK